MNQGYYILSKVLQDFHSDVDLNSVTHTFTDIRPDHNAPIWAPPEGKIKFPGNSTASQDKLTTVQQLVCTNQQAGRKDHQLVPSTIFDWWS